LNPHINPQRINRDIRVKYLRKQITEDQFKALLKRRDKRFHFTRENHQVLEMYVQSAIDIMTRYNQKTTDLLFVESIWTPFEIELCTLRSHTNKCLQKIADTYQLQPRTITFEFGFM
jgi:replication initiation and membrane attachment protein DnaB